jgi:hypothetical protein
MRTVVLAVATAGCILAAGTGGFVAVKLAHADTSSAPQYPAQRPPEQTPPSQPSATPPQATTTVPILPAEVPPAPKTKGVPVVNVPVVKTPTTRTPQARVPVVKAPAGARVEAIPVPDARSPVANQPTTSVPVATVPAIEQPTTPPVPVAPVAAIQPVETEKPRQVDEVTLPTDSVIGIRMDGAISTETAKIEDRVTAHVTRDVTVSGRVAIPAGTKLEGNVTLVERGGKFKDRARLGVRFTTIILADNVRVPIQTETIFRVGEAPTPEATTKIGASAVVGTLLGAVIGGKRGAAIGTAAGAAGGTAAVMAGDRNETGLANNAPLTVRLTAPVTFLIDRQQ